MSKQAVLEAFGLWLLAYPERFGAQDTSTMREEIKATIRLYQECLADVPDPLLAAAARQLIGSSKWFPKISEVREAAAALALRGQPSPHEAWILVKREIVRS